MSRISEQDEFLLSQLLDGDLTPDQASALRERMTREPELQVAYDELAEVNVALAQQADQPVINWVEFHADVMTRVNDVAAEAHASSANEAHGSGSVIKLSRWLSFAMPMAAAAAIALVVTQWGGSGAVDAPNPGHLEVATNHNNTAVVPGVLTVSVTRPVTRPITASSLRVAYSESTALDATYARIDSEERSDRSAFVSTDPEEWPDDGVLPDSTMFPELVPDFH